MIPPSLVPDTTLFASTLSLERSSPMPRSPPPTSLLPSRRLRFESRSTSAPPELSVSVLFSMIAPVVPLRSSRPPPFSSSVLPRTTLSSRASNSMMPGDLVVVQVEVLHEPALGLGQQLHAVVELRHGAVPDDDLAVALVADAVAEADAVDRVAVEVDDDPLRSDMQPVGEAVHEVVGQPDAVRDELAAGHLGVDRGLGRLRLSCRRRREPDHHLRRELELLACIEPVPAGEVRAVELVAHQPPVVDAADHLPHVRGDVPRHVAVDRPRRDRGPLARRLVLPGHGRFRPGLRDRDGLHLEPLGARVRVQAQPGRLDHAARRHLARQLEAHQRARVAAHVQHRVGALVGEGTVQIDPGVGFHRRDDGRLLAHSAACAAATGARGPATSASAAAQSSAHAGTEDPAGIPRQPPSPPTRTGIRMSTPLPHFARGGASADRRNFRSNA